MHERSTPQQMRQETRERSGRYATSAPCEACGKPAGFDYLSVSSPDPYGLTLCRRVRCPAQRLYATLSHDEAERQTKELCRQRAESSL